MKNLNLLVILACFAIFSCKTDKKNQTTETEKDLAAETSNDMSSNNEDNALEIHPISHATMVMSIGEDNIFVDPTGGAEAFSSFDSAEIVLLTDIHGDHYNIETLKALDLSNATVIAPKAVVDLFPKDLKTNKTVTLNNGDSYTTSQGFSIEAMPMYNLREEALKFHPKGRGNGYVLTINNERIYISGDTEDIPEMRNLKNIDKAFVCMNLPYTMTVEKAVEAVLEFKPETVYPYHYRGKDGMSDVEKFKTLVNLGNEEIKVVQLDWYN